MTDDKNIAITGATMPVKLDYVSRKIVHWNRMGTPSQLDPETGAAAPTWVLEQRDERRKRAARLRTQGRR